MSAPAERPYDLDELLERLRASKILYSVEECGPGNEVVHISVMGERWDVEFFPSSPPEVEVFRSTGEVFEIGALERLFERFGDKPT